MLSLARHTSPRVQDSITDYRVNSRRRDVLLDGSGCLDNLTSMGVNVSMFFDVSSRA